MTAVLTRLPDWEQRLHDFLVDHADVQFGWGAKDCALFGADAVFALTGVDHGAAFRGKYDDAAGAAQALKTFGGGTILRTFDQFLPRVRAAFAQRGDLAMIGGRGITGSVGLIIGSDAVFVTDLGLTRHPRAAWLRCWKVG